MTPFNLFIIFGTGILFSTSVTSNPTPEYVPADNFEECRQIADTRGEFLNQCIRREFTDEAMNETLQMYNGSRCPRCHHLCRKQEPIINCIQTGGETLKTLSNKSRYMVPFIVQLAETVITSLCENDAEIMDVADGEDKQCFRSAWLACKSHAEFMDDLDRIAFCDAASPESDPFTVEYVCQKIMDFFACVEDDMKSCSLKVLNSVASFKSKLSNHESCAK